VVAASATGEQRFGGKTRAPHETRKGKTMQWAKNGSRQNSMQVTPLTALPSADARTEQHVNIFALEWFSQMRAGEIDRSHLSSDYSAHLTDGAVRKMAEYLRAHDFGAEPIGTQIMRRGTNGDQAFYLVKILYPRGDAASLLFGFNTASKITGVTLISMAGD